MMRAPVACLSGLLLVTLLSSCGTRSPLGPEDPRGDPLVERRLAPEIEADARSLSADNRRFALDVYARLRETPGNLFLSPFSLSTAFAMVHAGAAGQTRDEIASVFHFTLPQEKLDPIFGALLRSLDRGTQFGGYELRVANRAWGQRDFPFLQSYLDVTRDQYGAEFQPADFIGEYEPTRLQINEWVAQRTNGRIVDLFPPGSIVSTTRLVLANAIFFKGLWALPFDRKMTTDGPFHVNGGEPVSVPTMRQENEFRMAGSEDVVMIDLPYQGKDLSMFILLPREVDGLAALEAKLTPERLEALKAGLTERQVRVALPRFEFSSKFSLPSTLAGMGMPSAFDPSNADFSGIDGRRDLSITSALHQAFIEVNEEGTEAAAATGVGMGITSSPPAFTADHPFLFLIYDHVTGSILFLVRVVDPRA